MLARAPRSYPVFRRARFAPPRRHRNGELAGEIFPGDRVGIPLHLGDSACGEQRPPNSPAPGPKIEQIVGRTNHIGIVLDNEDRIAQIAQLLENADQLRGVARMQANRGLVQT